jgi:hypothetical protein
MRFDVFFLCASRCDCMGDLVDGCQGEVKVQSANLYFLPFAPAVSGHPINF